MIDHSIALQAVILFLAWAVEYLCKLREPETRNSAATIRTLVTDNFMSVNESWRLLSAIRVDMLG